MKYYGTKDGINYGFYLQQFDGAKEIPDDEWKRLLNEQSNGKKICLGDDGNVIAVEEVITCDELASDIRRIRRIVPDIEYLVTAGLCPALDESHNGSSGIT